MVVISDTSVLSALAEIGAEEILPMLVGQIVVTEAVFRECLAPEAPVALRNLLLNASWIIRVSDPVVNLPETASLDPGEASAISYAWSLREQMLLLVDDADARKICQALQLRIMGTAGLIFEAASRKLLDFDLTFEKLRQTSFRISTAVIDELRKKLPTNPAP